MSTQKKTETENENEKLEIPLSQFFSRWFYISILLITSGLLFASAQADHPSHTYILGLCSKLLEDVGIAIFVANIFSFTLGTKEFLLFVRDRLISIVLSKDFVTKLNLSEQKKLLHMVLKPSKELSNVYSGINDYFNQYVEDSMLLFANCYRGHMVIDAVASFNNDKNCIQVELDIDYVFYKVSERFEPLKLGLEDESFEHIHTIVRQGANEEKLVTTRAIEKPGDQGMARVFEMEIPEKFNQYNQINISRRIVEYGNDHWQIFSYKNFSACDRLTVGLRCSDGIVVRQCSTYGKQERFAIEQSELRVKVMFNDWLSPGFGVNIMVAKDNFHEVFNGCPAHATERSTSENTPLPITQG